MDVENSIMCQKDYVELSTRQKYCGNRTGAFLIRNNKAVIDFVTDDSNSGTGFSGTITALCKFMYLYWQGGKCCIIIYVYCWFWKYLQQATKLHIKLFSDRYVFDRTDFFWLFPMQNLVNLKIYRMFDFYVFQYFLHNKNPTSHLLLLTMTVSLYQSIIFSVNTSIYWLSFWIVFLLFLFDSFLKTHHLANLQIHHYQKRSMDFLWNGLNHW